MLDEEWLDQNQRPQTFCQAFGLRQFVLLHHHSTHVNIANSGNDEPWSINKAQITHKKMIVLNEFYINLTGKFNTLEMF